MKPARLVEVKRRLTPLTKENWDLEREVRDLKDVRCLAIPPLQPHTREFDEGRSNNDLLQTLANMHRSAAIDRKELSKSKQLLAEMEKGSSARTA